MRRANILSVAQVATDLNTLQLYAEYLSVELREHEVSSLVSLCALMESAKANARLFDEYYISYKIPQISKEFDLLRISDEMVINIELKSENTYEKIKKQLNKNRCYLSYLDREIVLFSYVDETKTIYQLKDGELISVDIIDLITALERQKLFYEGELDSLFNPSNYLVSPFNSTKKFVEDKYFLTSQQEEIEEKLKAVFQRNSFSVVAIEGKPGTGKTLLLYHLAKQCMRLEMNPLVIHTGNLNEGQYMLRNDYGWSIFPVKSTRHILDEKEATYAGGKCKYDCIILDETQRINENQFDIIHQFAKSHNIACIIGFDRQQVLCGKEKHSNVVPSIEQIALQKFVLTEKIRTNKEIAQFIRAMFDLKKKVTTKITNVSITYFAEYKDARQYIETKENFCFISYTPSQYHHNDIDTLQFTQNYGGTAHGVIGQEFDNVLAVVDSLFYYDKDKCLQGYGRSGNPYAQKEMLYQALTRVRRKLEIVVINNFNVFRELLAIVS